MDAIEALGLPQSQWADVAGPVHYREWSGPEDGPPQLVLPLGQIVRIHLTSDDVIHAFYVPGFLFKRDAIPGHPTDFNLTPSKAGTYLGECAEFCGLNHAFMTFIVRVVTPTQFTAWLRQKVAA